jgi:signal transduction histidine kinase
MVREPASITQPYLQRLLLLGLCLSAILLLSALLVALRTVHQIDNNTQVFADRQALAKEAIDGIERDQADLNNRWLQLARKSDVVRREEILDQLTQSRLQMSAALETAYEQAELLRESIYQEGHGLLRWTVWLFAVCVGLSLLCATWAVRASAGLFRKLQQQAAELSKMQYQFLESQEDIARRFSHELHDELGQALTAVKANLSALRGHHDDARVEDCSRLVDRAIKDVREMSQLLRPTILDDFGLDAALRSLAESFSQRTGIEVQYHSNLESRRLPDEAETNLFRIAQEALTNVARHSQATGVVMELMPRGRQVTLAIRDNGHGFDSAERRSLPGLGSSELGLAGRGLGLAGMETRARGCGGSLILESTPGKGLKIEVTCPIAQ